MGCTIIGIICIGIIGIDIIMGAARTSGMLSTMTPVGGSAKRGADRDDVGVWQQQQRWRPRWWQHGWHDWHDDWHATQLGRSEPQSAPRKLETDIAKHKEIRAATAEDET